MTFPSIHPLQKRRDKPPDVNLHKRESGLEVLEPPVRHRIELQSVRTQRGEDDDTESGGKISVRAEKAPFPEHVAISASGVRGVAVPSGATPLVVAIRRIPLHGTASSGDGALCASYRSREQATEPPL